MNEDQFLKLISDKKIIIIGPSENVKNDFENMKDTDFDIVVRINNHFKYKQDTLGTNIIYHNMINEIINSEDLLLFKKNNILLVSKFKIDINSTHPSNRRKSKNFLNENEHVNFDNIYEMKKASFLSKYQKPKKPWNLGCIAILHLLTYPIKELHLIGFDFYETNYNHEQDINLKKRMLDSKNVELTDENFTKFRTLRTHDPKEQLNIIKKIYKNDIRFKAHGRTKEIIE